MRAIRVIVHLMERRWNIFRSTVNRAKQHEVERDRYSSFLSCDLARVTSLYRGAWVPGSVSSLVEKIIGKVFVDNLY